MEVQQFNKMLGRPIGSTEFVELIEYYYVEPWGETGSIYKAITVDLEEVFVCELKEGT